MQEKIKYFLGSLFSRKLILTVIAFLLAVIFPESEQAILLLLGTYVGGNVVQKFSSSKKAVGIAKEELVKLLESLKKLKSMKEMQAGETSQDK